MRKLKSIVALALVVLWLPASSHALLQHVEFIHQVYSNDDDLDGGSDGPHEHDTDNHAAADGICHVASTHVQVPQPELGGALWLGSVNLPHPFAPLFETSLALPDGPDPPGVAPPELSHTWQFSFRASLPPRAPSLIF